MNTEYTDTDILMMSDNIYGDQVSDDIYDDQILDEQFYNEDIFDDYDDELIINKLKEKELDELTKTLNNMVGTLQIFIKNPTNDIYRIREEFINLCNDKRHIIDEIFLLKKLEKEINGTILECESIIVQQQFKNNGRDPPQSIWDENKLWGHIKKKYSHIFK